MDIAQAAADDLRRLILTHSLPPDTPARVGTSLGPLRTVPLLGPALHGGEELIVTDRGSAVARVLPVGTERVIDRLIAEGVVTPAPQPKRRAGTSTKGTGAVSDLIVDQRR